MTSVTHGQNGDVPTMFGETRSVDNCAYRMWRWQEVCGDLFRITSCQDSDSDCR